MMTTTLILDELKDVRSHCEDQVSGSKLVTCVPAMVRVDIKRTEHKHLTACLQFPSGYPHEILLVEVKSRHLSERLLDGLAKMCEEELKKVAGKPQILYILKYLRKFIDENPLCVCSEEISLIKRALITEQDRIRLKQKSSSLGLTVTQGLYRVQLTVQVPDRYPLEKISLEWQECNFPNLFKKWLSGQAIEISRQSVEPPLKKNPKAPPFKPKPSLQPVIEFIIRDVKRFPKEICYFCKEQCFPNDPQDVINSLENPKFVEKVYCGHIFHNGCLNNYMNTPPFHDGKMCPNCTKRIFHDKWSATPNLTEARWAHQEARKRELAEVDDFFNG